MVNGLTPVAVREIKYSSTPILSKGFYIVLNDLAIKNAYVIIPQGNQYQLDEKVTVSSLQYFLKELLPELYK